jgi:hypothetical protein
MSLIRPSLLAPARAVCMLETEEDRDTLHKILTDNLYDQWFESRVPLPGVGYVGPLESTTEADLATPAPMLKVGFITDGAGPNGEAKSVLAFPRDALEQKFGGTPSIWEKVSALLDAHVARFGRPSNLAAAGAGPGRERPSLGPNMSVNPPAADPVVDMATLATSTIADAESKRCALVWSGTMFWSESLLSYMCCCCSSCKCNLY